MLYLVSFVFRSTVDAPPGLVQELDRLGPWSDRLKPTWILESELPSKDVRDALKRHLGPRDRIFVGEVSRNWAASGMGEGFGEWMAKRASTRRSHGTVDARQEGKPLVLKR